MQHTRPDSPSHQAGVHKGEEWSRKETEPGRGKSDPGARNSTASIPTNAGRSIRACRIIRRREQSVVVERCELELLDLSS